MEKNLDQKASYLLILYSFIVFGYSYSLGFYSIASLIILTLSAFLCLCFWKLNFSKDIFNINLTSVAKIVLISFVILSYFLYGGLYQSRKTFLVEVSSYLLVLCIPLSFTFLLTIRNKISLVLHFRFWFFVLIVVLLKLFMIWSSPSPLIDVYGIQTLAPNAILEGLNPYSIVYHFPWEKSPLDVYSYGPFNIYLNFIAFFTFHDPRYVQIFSEIGVGLLVYVLLRKHKLKKQNRNIPEMLSLIFLFSPRSLLILEQAWIDPVLLFLIFLFATLLFVWKRPALAFIVLGLAIATKQYAILLLPFLLFGGIMKVKNFLTTVIVVFAASLPFLIWNFKDFIRDVVLFSIFVYPSRYDSLSWNTFVHGITGHDIPKLVILLMELFLFYF